MEYLSQQIPPSNSDYQTIDKLLATPFTDEDIIRGNLTNLSKWRNAFGLKRMSI